MILVCAGVEDLVIYDHKISKVEEILKKFQYL
jgi:hypothetical protein